MIPNVIDYAEMSSRLPRGRFCREAVPFAAGVAIARVALTTGPPTARAETAAGLALPAGETLNAPREVLEIMAAPERHAMMKIVLTRRRTGPTGADQLPDVEPATREFDQLRKAWSWSRAVLRSATQCRAGR